uniref:Uncharacterized protein n=1 Tax=Rhizophora mucronata TaxID=61149 RepID=A0A2P2QM15_RHIMU
MLWLLSFDTLKERTDHLGVCNWYCGNGCYMVVVMVRMACDVSRHVYIRVSC